jgi:putative drug exporter of the RND superfamily
VRSLTALALRRPRSVLVAWGAIIIVLAAIGLGAQNRLSTGSIVPPGSQSARTAVLDETGFGPNDSLLILLEGPRSQIERQGPTLVHKLRRSWSLLSPWDPGHQSSRLRPSATRALVLLDLTARSVNDLEARLEVIRGIVRHSLAPPVRAQITGFTAIKSAIRAETLHSAAVAQLISIPILVVVLLLVFRAPLAAAVPGIIGVGTVGASAGVISLLGRSMELSALAVSTAAMMGLALGVDYSLLIVSRFREELAAGPDIDSAHAARTAASTAGRTVLFAGAILLTTMMVAVLLSPGDLLLSVTIGVTTAVVISMVSGIVVVPALLLLFGSRIDRWHLGSPVRHSRLLPALAAFAIRRAPAILAASVLALAALGALALDLHTAALNVRVLPASNPARRNVTAVSKLVGYGYVTPFEIALHTPHGLITEPRTLDAVEHFQSQLLKDPGVLSLIGPGALASNAGSVLEVPRQLPTLRKQAARATSGIARLRKGLHQASVGAERLREGAHRARAGIARLGNGADQLDAGAAALSRGVHTAAHDSRELAKGESSAARGAAELRDGATTASSGSRRLLQGVAVIDAEAADLDEGMHKLTATLSADSSKAPSIEPGLSAAEEQLHAAWNALERMTVGRGDTAYASLLTAVANATAITSGVDPATGAHTASALPSTLAQGSEAMEGLASEARDLSGATTELQSAVRQVRKGAMALDHGLSRLQHGQSQLSSGLDDAARRVGAAQSQFGRLVAGAGQLANGTSQLSSGIGRLGAIGRLATGNGRLATRLAQGYRDAAPLARGLSRSTHTLDAFPDLNGQLGAGHMLLAGVQSAEPARRSQLSYVLDIDGAGQDARMFVFPRIDPTTNAFAKMHDRIAHQTAAFARRTDIEAAIGGPGSYFVDFQRVVSTFIPTLILVLSLLTFVLLVVVLRALLIPAVAIALNLLIVAATFGLLTMLFQGAHPLIAGPGSIDVTTAAGIFTILFALSLDYQVFLLTRMREGFLRSGDADSAIRHGIAHTARVVTGAAIIMAAVFLSFGASEFAIPRQLGIGLAIAVLLDALLLRLFMLPAAMHLLGARGWWMPLWLDRVLPHFDLEGETEVEGAGSRRVGSRTTDQATA